MNKNSLYLYLSIVAIGFGVFYMFGATYDVFAYWEGIDPYPGYSCPSTSCTGPTPCWNNESVGVSNCGTPCANGFSWSKYLWTECRSYDVGLNCGEWYTRSANVCSSGDKYDSSWTPVMKSGWCNCAVGGSYKTCCSGSTPVAARQLSVDSTNPPYE